MPRLFIGSRPPPILWVVASPHNWLTRTLKRALGQAARVRWASDLPLPRSVEETEAVVLDLTGRHDPKWADWVPRLSEVIEVWLVWDQREIAPSFLPVTRASKVKLFQVPHSGDDDSRAAALATGILASLHGPAPEEIVSALLRRDPLLAKAESLLLGVCRHPWGIRLPRDLVAAVGGTLRSVRAQSRALGFRRVEHLITATRMLIYEHATTTFQLSHAVARRLAGIADLSNWRRQVLRAEGGAGGSSAATLHRRTS